MSQVPRPALVLDTNVVLDWLLFADPSSVPLAAAVRHGWVRWIATPAMREELAEVLRRGLAASRGVDPDAVLADWDAHAEVLAVPVRPAGVSTLQCADPDDQKFIDLAHGAGARWLLGRDRAVLRLARAASARGFTIAVPEGWSAPP